MGGVTAVSGMPFVCIGRGVPGVAFVLTGRWVPGVCGVFVMGVLLGRTPVLVILALGRVAALSSVFAEMDRSGPTGMRSGFPMVFMCRAHIRNCNTPWGYRQGRIGPAAHAGRPIEPDHLNTPGSLLPWRGRAHASKSGFGRLASAGPTAGGPSLGNAGAG